ncbi:hypothetical protein ACJIZ3_020027 [Penstemon smallii]|uniref:SBP-type domain-containing protein n=1 Tax=Penstemon smallii TaxID=265156 RepID=A0ABD3SI19_9LAMI
MEPFSYAFEGKDLIFTDNIEFTMDGVMRSRNVLGAPKVSNGSQFSIEDSVFSSLERSVCAKRARVTNFQSQNLICQVYGCNKDLSSSKDYYKRHKVCEVHSKTSVVNVNGIQQRFCQQCSRFHILAEFDEDKRSCRKRLAGHNERRRKPQLDTHFGCGSDLSSTSLLFSEIIPDDFFGQQCIKLEEEPHEMKFGYSFPKSLLYSHNIGKRYPSKICLNEPLSIQELSEGSNSSYALSLLSAQSQTSSKNSAGISINHTLVSNQISPTTSAGMENPQNEPPHNAPNTVDLVQLSLHLQRIEEQKHSAQVKMGNGVLSTIT